MKMNPVLKGFAGFILIFGSWVFLLWEGRSIETCANEAKTGQDFIVKYKCLKIQPRTQKETNYKLCILNGVLGEDGKGGDKIRSELYYNYIVTDCYDKFINNI
jgi:hypothetical protein